MHTELINIPRHEAFKLYKQYKSHVGYSEPATKQVDAEVRRAYYLLSKGRVIIKALESIKQAGLNRDFLPKLALAPATASTCYLTRYRDGQFRMSPREGWTRSKRYDLNFREQTFVFPAESFPLDWDRKSRRQNSEHKAQVPLIPSHLRPKRGLANYHVLWEAEWERLPPRDPYLLRRIGKADLWLVVAHWDLTEVERAALATRV
jgi:hypothetical protein